LHSKIFTLEKKLVSQLGNKFKRSGCIPNFSIAALNTTRTLKVFYQQKLKTTQKTENIHFREKIGNKLKTKVAFKISALYKQFANKRLKTLKSKENIHS
jgi:hypothetical protein